MYYRHKVQSVLLICLMFIICLIFNLKYSYIANLSITVVSIALAVYISISSSLLGSPFSRLLKRTPDKENPSRSMLGTLADYLKTARLCSIATITASSLYLLKPDFAFLKTILKTNYYALSNIISSLFCSLFAYNVFLMSLIMNFMIVALMNAATLPEEEPSSVRQTNRRND